MSFYNKITELINSSLNDDNQKFNVSFLDNTEAYNEDNLIYDEMVQGVTRLTSTSLNPLGDVGSENRVDVMQLEMLIPLGQEDTTYFRNKIINTMSNKINSTMHQFDNIEVLITDVQCIQDSKLNGHINGVEYEDIVFQFTLIVSVDFLYSNEGILKVDNEVIDCKASVILSAEKMATGDIYNNSDYIQRGRFNGLRYSFEVNLTYNKNNKRHSALLANWMCKGNFNIYYKLDTLELNRTCQMISYTCQAITGDTVKLRIIFQEAEADFVG